MLFFTIFSILIQQTIWPLKNCIPHVPPRFDQPYKQIFGSAHKIAHNGTFKHTRGYFMFIFLHMQKITKDINHKHVKLWLTGEIQMIMWFSPFNNNKGLTHIHLDSLFNNRCSNIYLELVYYVATIGATVAGRKIMLAFKENRLRQNRCVGMIGKGFTIQSIKKEQSSTQKGNIHFSTLCK